MSVNLSGKFIPMEYFNEYTGHVRPDEKHKISPSGEEIMPKEFSFRLVLDRFGNAYFIPIVLIETPDRKIYRVAYTIENVLEAASGDTAKQKLIEDWHNKLKNEYLNEYIMEDRFQHAFYGTARSTFERDYEQMYGKKPALPEQITTHRNMSQDKIDLLAREAKSST